MQSDKLNLLAVKNPNIRTLHFTWVAFFMTFVVWFNHAPLGAPITQAFNLSREQWKALLLLNVAILDAGFESGHAYGKALRTFKSCVGSTWCHS